jgi:hypothetical protein
MSRITRKLRAQLPELDLQMRKEETLRAASAASDLLPLMGAWVRQITPRIRLDLELAGSPFLTGRSAMLKDVWVFLWRVSPHYVPAWKLGIFRTPRAWYERQRLRFICQRADLWAFESAIHEFISDAYQDAPGSSDDDDGSSSGPECNASVGWAAFYMEKFGMDFDQYMDTPILVLHQLLRAWKAMNGFTCSDSNKSDLIATRFVSKTFKRKKSNGTH